MESGNPRRRPDHVFFKNRLQHGRSPPLQKIQSRRQGVAGDGDILVCLSRYVDLKPKLLIVDIIPALVIPEAFRNREQDSDALAAGRLLRVGIHGAYDIKSHVRDHAVAVYAMVNINRTQVAKDAHTDPS